MAKSINFDDELGLSTSDRFSHYLNDFFRGKKYNDLKQYSLGDMIQTLTKDKLLSTVNVHPTEDRKYKIRLVDFFANRLKRKAPLQINVSYEEENGNKKEWKRAKIDKTPPPTLDYDTLWIVLAVSIVVSLVVVH